MQIPVNKNIDHYKDDFFKGMTMRQAIFGIATVTAGAAAFLFFYIYLELPAMVSVYLMLPIAMPVAAVGFLKIDGKSPGDYLKKRRRTVRTPLYRFVPVMLMEQADQEHRLENAPNSDYQGKGNKRKKGSSKVYLQISEDEGGGEDTEI